MRQCGVKELSEPEVLSLEKKKRAILNHRRKKRDEAIVIDVHFHVITSSSGGGALSESSIDEQMEVLNAAFNPHFMFLKRSVETVENDDWFVMGMGTSSEIMVKSSLRIGTGEELNIYTAELTDDLLGWSSFPYAYASDPANDGIVVHFASFPGGWLAPYDLGDTATHEVGHWLGLYHTFQGGCIGLGDYVDDTPAVQTANTGCPANVDSCPYDGLGNDLTENFMDYTDDACMNSFTAGQFLRAKEEWFAYRDGSQCSINCMPTYDLMFRVDNIAGAMNKCSNITGVYGSPTAIGGEFHFESHNDVLSWASDFAIAVFNPFSKVGYQFGGFSGKSSVRAAPDLSVMEWPDSWNTHFADTYAFKKMTPSSVEFNGLMSVCFGNSFENSSGASYHGQLGFTNLSKMNSAPTVAPLAAAPSASPSPFVPHDFDAMVNATFLLRMNNTIGTDFDDPSVLALLLFTITECAKSSLVEEVYPATSSAASSYKSGDFTSVHFSMAARTISLGADNASHAVSLLYDRLSETRKSGVFEELLCKVGRKDDNAPSLCDARVHDLSVVNTSFTAIDSSDNTSSSRDESSFLSLNSSKLWLIVGAVFFLLNCCLRLASKSKSKNRRQVSAASSVSIVPN